MLLAMGVRDCPEQVEVYSEVLSAVKDMVDIEYWCLEYLDDWESVLSGVEYLSGSFGLVDLVVYCSTYNLFRYVMVPTWRNHYPNISSLCCRVSLLTVLD